MTKYKVGLRSIDDVIIEAVQELDKSLNHCLLLLAENHSTFLIDALVEMYSTIGTGGVRVFLGSRKKVRIKAKIISIISDLPDSKKFIHNINRLGLIRGKKEELVASFILSIQDDFLKFVNRYEDPSKMFIEIYPTYLAYVNLKQMISKATYNYLSKIVLTKYSGWTNMRRLKSDLDYQQFEEDVQNTIFSITKALDNFAFKKHKSFFSFCTFRLKEGVKSSTFTIDNEMFTDETGKKVRAEFISLATIDYDNVPYVDKEDTENIVDVWSYISGSFPLPSELRIYNKLRKLKESKLCNGTK